MLEGKEIIYHYCSVASFAEIVQTQKIWLSHARTTNDSLEGRVLINKIIEVQEKNHGEKSEYGDILNELVAVFFIAILLVFVKMLSNREWTVEHNGNVIRVENTWVRETLYVNAGIQDENVGLLASRSKLWGKLPTGEEVKVSIGSTLNFHCNIFVDQKLAFKK